LHGIVENFKAGNEDTGDINRYSHVLGKVSLLKLPVYYNEDDLDED
jgi:hypothetical protein